MLSHDYENLETGCIFAIKVINTQRTVGSECLHHILFILLSLPYFASHPSLTLSAYILPSTPHKSPYSTSHPFSVMQIHGSYFNTRQFGLFTLLDLLDVSYITLYDMLCELLHVLISMYWKFVWFIKFINISNNFCAYLQVWLGNLDLLPYSLCGIVNLSKKTVWFKLFAYLTI